MKGFRDFLLRGNVVDLAVAVVIGTAFVALVTAFTKSFITPLIGLLGVKGAFDNAKFTVNGTDFTYGLFVDAVIAFVILAAIVYFLVVIPVQHLMERASKPAAGPTTRPCPECLSDIPMAARRCAFCTAQVAPQA